MGKVVNISKHNKSAIAGKTSRYSNAINLNVGEVKKLELTACPQCGNSDKLTFVKHFDDSKKKINYSMQYYCCFECEFKSYKFPVNTTENIFEEVKNTKEEEITENIKVVPLVRTAKSNDAKMVPKMVRVSFDVDRSFLFDILDTLEEKGLKEAVRVKSVG